ncbi:oxalate transporter [Trametes meyenii]|nr:oxalate transporter [Trametes meyenii]
MLHSAASDSYNTPYSDYPRTVPDDRSAYSMATVYDMPSPTARTSLLSSNSSDSGYGATAPSQPSSRRLLWNATLKMAAIFFISTVLLGGTLWLALPTLEEQDRPMLKIPKSFTELQALNTLLKKYRDIYPYRIVVCYVITYFFLQAFSLPGSMYLSILGGAVWGVPRALPLACACVATGATLCYLISAALGPALLTMPKWKAKLDVWADKLRAHKDDMISFLIVLRIAPLPPHWVVNVLCPHVGIGVIPFWISTFLGIFGVTVIHTTIGGSLDDMTSADDFHLISWKNFFLLSSVVVGVMIPVGLRYYFRRDVATVADVEAEAEAAEEEVEGDRLLAEGPRVDHGKGRAAPLILFSDDESELYTDEESDEDVILEAGPALIIKHDGEQVAQPQPHKPEEQPAEPEQEDLVKL